MKNNKKLFYENLAKDSLKNININTKRSNTYKKNYNKNKKTNKFSHILILALIFFCIYYISTQKSTNLFKEVEIIFTEKLNLDDNIKSLLNKINKKEIKNNIHIDDKTINEMNENIKYSEKKKISLKGENLTFGANKKFTQNISPIKEGIISDTFGNRINPITNKEEFHNGIDISASLNTPVYAISNGKILDSGFSDTYGNYIKYITTDGYEIFYAHLNEVLIKSGDIKIGDILGLVGNTGLSTGYHLHYSILKDDKYLDPLPFTNLPKADYL